MAVEEDREDAEDSVLVFMPEPHQGEEHYSRVV